MRLTEIQIGKIKAYLNFKELFHLDLRNEVLDHIANGIENSIDRKKLDFNSAFDLEIKKWNNELAGYSTSWLGWAYHGPKIMMRKCAKITKRAYLQSTIIALVLALILNLISTVISPAFSTLFMKIMLGISYLTILSAMLFFYYRIKQSDYQTSYSYLYRIHTIGCGFVFLVLNPLWTNLLNFKGNLEVVIVNLFAHLFFIIFSLIFWDLYKSHMNINTFKVA